MVCGRIPAMMLDVDLSRIHAATEGLSRLLLVLARALRRTPGRVELAGELAAARIHLDRLAEMVGADLVEEERAGMLRRMDEASGRAKTAA